MLQALITEARTLIEFEIYVDEKGYAHDDEGNTWFVGKEYGGQTYGLNNPLPKGGGSGYGGGGSSYDDLSNAESAQWQERAGKLLAALMLKGRKLDFIRSITTKKIRKGYRPTYKQEAAWVKTEGYMKSTIAKFPKDGKWSTWNNALPSVYKAGAKMVAWLEVNFQTKSDREPGYYEITGALSKADQAVQKKAASAAKKAGSSKSSVASSGTDQMDVIRKAMKKRADPFLTTVLKAMGSEKEWRKGVSKDTLKGIRHQLYKRGMRKEADLFR